MTSYSFPVMLTGTAINCAAAAIAAGAIIPGYAALYSAAYLPTTKISWQMAAGGTHGGFVGPSTVDTTSAHATFELPAASATAPGGGLSLESHVDGNTLNLAQFSVNGTSGEVMIVTYHQN